MQYHLFFTNILHESYLDELAEAPSLSYDLDAACLASFPRRDIDAGQVTSNEYFAGGIALPFGGNRRSGFGRERGMEALRSYSRIKAVAARISSLAGSSPTVEPEGGRPAEHSPAASTTSA